MQQLEAGCSEWSGWCIGAFGSSHMVCNLAILDILTEKKERGASHMVRNLTILDVGKKMPNPELMEKKGRGVQSCE